MLPSVNIVNSSLDVQSYTKALVSNTHSILLESITLFLY